MNTTNPKEQERKDWSEQQAADVTHIDPNIPQRQASDPNSSVWVSASAGSGKTKVLTERVIRLLLPRENGEAGSDPEKILCITFTKAASAEMAIRINKTLGEWSIASDEELQSNLEKLLGTSPTSHQLQEARKLFAKVVDTPGGLKIMTIHAFCQSILSRFPLEANLPPHFEVLDEHDTQTLIKQARNNYFKKNKDEENNHLSQAFAVLATHKNEEQFSSILTHLLSERRQLRTILKQYGSDDTLTYAYRTLFEIPDHIGSEKDIIDTACQTSSFDKTGLYQLCEALSHGTPKDQEKGVRIQTWLDNNSEYRAENFIDYKFDFLKKTDGQPQKFNKKPSQFNPHAETIFLNECERLIKIEDQKKAYTNYKLSTLLIQVASGILEEYEKIKKQQAVLDFDDMILTTLDLLSGKTTQAMTENPAAWILYKLDQGLDHILLDEAQDTNPEQWEIIKILTDEFFHGFSAKENINRTLFVVGDEKQSIYSFQRANPEAFHRMNQYFANRIKQANRQWQNVQMNTSFRSTQAVLATVDETFNKPELKKGLGLDENTELKHNSFFKDRGGKVEIWPLEPAAEKMKSENWAPPIKVIENTPTEAVLAEKIARQIGKWIKNQDMLPSKNRPIAPSDVMILVKSRSAIVGHLIRALKKNNIAVAGADRLTLSEDLAIQDLLSAANFAILPDDDLNLACLLKSPIIGWNEEQLMNLALNRDNKSLWQTLKNKHKNDNNLLDFLQNLIDQSGWALPYEFFNKLLMSPSLTKKHTNTLLSIIERLGQDIEDPIEAFLNLCLNFESEHTPTLKNFTAWYQNDKRQIKREMEDGTNAVKIMTVHGSKGLQAPIVFLPDLIPSLNSPNDTRLLWPDKTELNLPIWSPSKINDSKIFSDAKTKITDKEYEEYLRLLYVAMTRAEDQLYITGFEKKRGRNDKSWMSLIEDSVNRLQNREIWPTISVNTDSCTATDKNESSSANGLNHTDDAQQRTTITNAQNADIKANIKNEPPEKTHVDAPEWIYKSAPHESEPPKTLTPSKATEASPSAASPLTSRDNNLYFLRGNITHKLLQILPDLSPDSWQEIATQYVSKSGQELNQRVQQEIVNETLKILTDETFAPVFGEGSRAEVPITSIINNQIINGQIDRLVITASTVLIIDYKTNRPSPESVNDIPPQYITQLKTYRDTIAITHPDKLIKCALLWTDRPKLQHIESLDIQHQ